MMHSKMVRDVAQPEIIPAQGRMKVPIHLFSNGLISPDAAARHQLQQLAEADGLDHYAVALPDIHAKQRNLSPTGSVVVSRDSLLPMAVDKGINCGMRMLRTELQATDLTPDLLDDLFARLTQLIPSRRHQKALIDHQEMPALLSNGGRWAIDHWGIPESELANIEGYGSMFTGQRVDEEQLLSAVPHDVIKKGPRVLGTLGGGNHFLEMQEVVELLDDETARLLGLQRGQIVFMLHTGSQRVGSMTMRYYSGHARPSTIQKRWKLQRRKLTFHRQGTSLSQFRTRINYFGNGRRFFTIPADSAEGHRFNIALQAATNFGFVNRMAITQALRQAVRSTMADQTMLLPLLYDCSHVSIQAEEHLGERIWVHRHGASKALPASAMNDHPVFAITGQPLPIPGSMGDDSYIGVAAAGAARTFNSVNHGAGRIMDKPVARQQFSKQAVAAELRSQNIRLYRTGTSDIAEQAPGSFKDISEVVRSMETLNLAKLVVRLRPVAVLKG